MVAAVGLPLAAGIALAAVHIGVEHHPVPYLNAVGVLSALGDLGDHAGDLMADDYGVGDVGAVPGVGVHVGAADAQGLHVDLGVARLQLRFGQVDQFNFLDVCDLYSFHKRFPLRKSFCEKPLPGLAGASACCCLCSAVSDQWNSRFGIHRATWGTKMKISRQMTTAVKYGIRYGRTSFILALAMPMVMNSTPPTGGVTPA